MGLIKSGLYVGAGLYAVNKLTKAHENHENQKYQQGHYQQQPQYNNGYPNQQYQGQPYQGQQYQGQQQSSRDVDNYYYQDFDAKPPAYNQRQQGFIEGEVSQSGYRDSAGSSSRSNDQALNFVGNMDSKEKSKRSKSSMSGLSGLLSK